jgi:hypothetical protein
VERRTRKPLLIAGGGAAAGGILIAIGSIYREAFNGWVLEDPRPHIRIIISIVTIVTSGPLLGMSIYCWRAAATKGRALRYLALFTGGSGLLLALLLWRFLFLLEQNAR